MKQKIAPIGALLLATLTAHAASPPVPDPPAVKARSYVLLDAATGQALAARGPELPVGPASLTKLMTLYVAFDQIRSGRLKSDDQALVSEKAWRQGMDSRESRMFIEVGKRVAVEDLIRGIVIQSGNDASIALAEHIAGAEDSFAQLMNQYAQRLGLAHSHFANATGVPAPGQQVTAADVARLCQALMTEFPDQFALFKEKEFVFNKIRQTNRNLLLWRDPAVDGVKTGHTESDGYHLAASATRDGRRLVAVVLGMESERARADAALALLNYGFRFYETVTLVAARAPMLTIRPWKGERQALALGVLRPLAVSIPAGGRDRVQLQTQVNEPVFAPVALGQTLGSVTVTMDGKTLRSEPLAALEDLPQGSLWRRLLDELWLWLKGLLGR